MNRQNLFDYRNNKIWVADRLEDIEERRKLLNKLTSTYSDMPKGSSPIHDKVMEDLIKLMDETVVYEKILLKLKNEMIEAEKIIDEIEDSTYKLILQKMYINEKPTNLTEIANVIYKEYKYTCTLHGKALNEFDNICKKHDKKG